MSNRILPFCFIFSIILEKKKSKSLLTCPEVSSIEYVSLCLFLFTLHHSRLFQWHDKLSTLTCSNKSIACDGAPYVTGIITVLKQFNSVHTHTYLSYLVLQ